MYHIFFIHSSVNGNLGSFHVLAIVDSAALKVYGRNQHNIVKIKKKNRYCPEVGAGNYSLQQFGVYSLLSHFV